MVELVFSEDQYPAGAAPVVCHSTKPEAPGTVVVPAVLSGTDAGRSGGSAAAIRVFIQASFNRCDP
jgi:hypothetical protein